jgi:hypothetical protein
MKNQHTLYIPDNKFATCKERGINISLVLNRALDRIMSDEDFDYTLHLDYIESLIGQDEERILALNIEREKIQKHIKKLKSEYKRVAAHYKEEEESIAMSRLLAALNNVIRTCKCDPIVTSTAAKEILRSISRLRNDFDLKKHIELVKETSSD